MEATVEKITDKVVDTFVLPILRLSIQMILFAATNDPQTPPLKPSIVAFITEPNTNSLPSLKLSRDPSRYIISIANN